jgi:hypothetical protein
MSKTPGNRRPIASRDTGWAKRTASFLAQRNISPNFISILSIVFSALSFLSFYLDYKMIGDHALLMIVAVACIQARLIMNLLDGMVAVEHNKKSVVGGLYNEAPDRVSDTLTIFGMGLLARHGPGLPCNHSFGNNGIHPNIGGIVKLRALFFGPDGQTASHGVGLRRLYNKHLVHPGVLLFTHFNEYRLVRYLLSPLVKNCFGLT